MIRLILLSDFIFDPLNNKDDVKCFAAVATSLNNYYPHADRSKNLYHGLFFCLDWA